uniref:Uncharacterized protein n=1 Tax=Chromera velia CCMP2878 TaxID=1169474 RepID=A0A0G4HTH9_9ALVE|eukprot:Cvel_31480.t1-p1 / transcript=Cvel_31480.t1 / gene=Cvel_31480 / organism=Chromera_velia_CCMP2878 / gene_product=Frataxin homolog, mitochondrial, putative / transcript_product=Frataxin homolog, mitochondrial, putative / location=Cvel_scaffold4698:147-2361(+) / protein_length=114 / sequence_SO=supercontig / SO=protein_coding / is_pseudo=false
MYVCMYVCVFGVQPSEQCLHDSLEEAEVEELEDLELREGVLTIDLGRLGIFVINKHFLTQQLWYSSPVSGAQYFDFSSNPKWMSQTLKQDLFTVLSTELSQLGVEIGLQACSQR